MLGRYLRITLWGQARGNPSRTPLTSQPASHDHRTSVHASLLRHQHGGAGSVQLHCVCRVRYGRLRPLVSQA